MAIEMTIVAVIVGIAARMAAMESVNKTALETILREGKWWEKYWITHQIVGFHIQNQFKIDSKYCKLETL